VILHYHTTDYLSVFLLLILRSISVGCGTCTSSGCPSPNTRHHMQHSNVTRRTITESKRSTLDSSLPVYQAWLAVPIGRCIWYSEAGVDWHTSAAWDVVAFLPSSSDLYRIEQHVRCSHLYLSPRSCFAIRNAPLHLTYVEASDQSCYGCCTSSIVLQFHETNLVI
jgi:hypothetical protein